MPNKMLIDATHPEETRVVVVRGNRVEEFDFETAQRKQRMNSNDLPAARSTLDGPLTSDTTRSGA